ncbi:MAG: hypothetical protein IVW55_10355 [Chloroflexi bacterium]|nr:hypothetical protein [Chloroflexota bacterium]
MRLKASGLGRSLQGLRAFVPGIGSILWYTTAALVTALVMRFAMRALGVRDDIPFPHLIYSLTTPLVQPFYLFFPVSDRFDYHAVEAASLAAAGVVLALAVGLYLLGLLLAGTKLRG